MLRNLARRGVSLFSHQRNFSTHPIEKKPNITAPTAFFAKPSAEKNISEKLEDYVTQFKKESPPNVLSFLENQFKNENAALNDLIYNHPQIVEKIVKALFNSNSEPLCDEAIDFLENRFPVLIPGGSFQIGNQGLKNLLFVKCAESSLFKSDKPECFSALPPTIPQRT